MQKSFHAECCQLTLNRHFIYYLSLGRKEIYDDEKKEISIIQDTQEVIDKQKIHEVSGYSPAEFTTFSLLLRHITVLQAEFFSYVSYTRN